FQAEDGIRDYKVTGVQTCALPISGEVNLFAAKKLTSSVDLSVLRCDVHSHFIPGIDDGSKSIENSIEMIRHFYNQGYKKIITTRSEERRVGKECKYQCKKDKEKKK